MAMTEIKSLLLHLDAGPLGPRLAVAHRLARDHGASLEVLYAVMPLVMQYPFALDASGLAAGELAQCQTDACSAAKAGFERECAALGLSGVAWRESAEDPVRGLRHDAWAADLVVLCQRDPREAAITGVPPDFVASVLVESGKPGLVLPYIGSNPGFGQNVLVAWKPSPESARAMTAALPMLERAGSVHLACWDEAGTGPADVAGPALRFLRRHGITATVHQGGTPTPDLGERLLSLAADLQSDLLVMGCYGHGRAREWALGGVTRTVLQSMTVPVLMVH